MQTTLRQRHRKNQRNCVGSSELSEFAPMLYVMFMIFLLPLINLVGVFLAAATLYLATNDFAAKAATQPNYSSALNSMVNEAYQFQNTGFASFVQMAPDGGYTGCGDDLYVLQTNLGTGSLTSSAADQPFGQTINTANNMYEISVKSVYNISPLVNLQSVPLLGEVPGLAKPVTLSFCANRPVEHPSGFQTTPSGSVAGTGSVTPFARVASNPAAPSTASKSTWRTPNIFSQIQAAGQTVLSVNVVNVPANDGPSSALAAAGGWVSTGIVVTPGQKVWLDTQATGAWGDSGLPGASSVDANGSSSYPHETWSLDYDLPGIMLVGYIGTAPIFPWGHGTGAISGNPHFIPSGDTLLNFPISYTGPISLACNENEENCSGAQQVRVIVTQ